MQRDEQIFELIKAEKERQINGIELIASENFTSEQVMEATGSVLTNKYAEGYPGKRYYGGCEIVDEVEQIAIDRAKTLFGAAWANVQPHSGSQANTAVFHACLKVGDKILGFDLSHGGHLTHGSPVNFSGRLYNPVFYGVEKETGVLDYDKIQEIATKEHPKLIIASSSVEHRNIFNNHVFHKNKLSGFGVLTPQTLSKYNIRAYSGREKFLALVFYYWTSMSDESTPHKMAGERFRETEVFSNRTNFELN